MDDSFQDLGGPYRQRLGIDGTAGDAQDIPHPYTSAAQAGGEGSACVVCGLAPGYAKHI